MYTFTYLTLLLSSQLAAKRPNFEFSQLQPSPLNGLRKFKEVKILVWLQWRLFNDQVPFLDNWIIALH